MIRVLIERNIMDGLDDIYEESVRNILQSAIQAPGFLAGESMKDASNPRRRLTLSKWRSQQDWINWLNSNERTEIMYKIDPMLSEPEKITILEHA
ncbi:antibiotic biosynthesis monooxygenase family protein [Litoribrevibacter euphylliae]|uniref:Antibiotic biosynthesis monooxygenase family protein n=1 Tax=Litoribrevibacter euphylliae TaxID=1834034 RepID=A0ABV7HB98_9GAMM